MELPNAVRNSELHVRFGPFSAEARLAYRAPLLCARSRLAGRTFAARNAHRTPRLCVPRCFSLPGAEGILVDAVAVDILVGVDADAFDILADADAAVFDVVEDVDTGAFEILLDADDIPSDILLEASGRSFSPRGVFACVHARSVVAGPQHRRGLRLRSRSKRRRRASASMMASPACALETSSQVPPARARGVFAGPRHGRGLGLRSRSRRRRRASAWPRTWPAISLEA